MMKLTLAVGTSILFMACGGEPAGKPAETAASAKSEKSEKSNSAPSDFRAVVDAPDRTAADRELDRGRKPAELLAFSGIKPGMKVAEIAATGGYTTELLARAVGPNGVVYAQNLSLIHI